MLEILEDADACPAGIAAYRTWAETHGIIDCPPTLWSWGLAYTDLDLRPWLSWALGRIVPVPPLRGAYLRDAYLRGAYLEGADLRGADLRGAYGAR